jgi:hypothetical protein
MKKSATIIKNYSKWVNESINEATPAQAAPAAEAISFIAASSSASNLGAGLAQKMGVKVNTLYTIQVQKLSHLTFIFQDGKFGGDEAKARGITIDAGTPVTAGQDILEIAGKTITETGSIVFTKAELGGPFTIKASNNGLLTIIRFGEALYTMGGTYKNYLGNNKDWAARFTMGGNVTEKDSRGFSFWFAKPGEVSADSSTIALIVAMSLLKASGNETRIAKNDPVYGGWYNAVVAGKTPQESIKVITDRTAADLQKRMMLVQNPTPDVTASWKIPNPLDLVIAPNEWEKIKAKLKPTAKALLEPVVEAIAKSIAPVTPPPGFGPESQAVFNAYTKMIYDGLVSKKGRVEYWFLACQDVNTWSKGTQQPGQAGQGTAAQGEGQFGKPAAKPTTAAPAAAPAAGQTPATN